MGDWKEKLVRIVDVNDFVYSTTYDEDIRTFSKALFGNFMNSIIILYIEIRKKYRMNF